MNSKTIKALICAAVMTLTLASCSKKDQNSDTTNDNSGAFGGYVPPEIENVDNFVDAGYCGENARYKLYSVPSYTVVDCGVTDGDYLLLINGTGDMYDYQSDDQGRFAIPLHELKSFKKAVITEGITSIGNSAFSECAELRTAELPGTLKSIGAHAFDGCQYLGNVTVANGVTSIGEEAFKGCASISVIAIPNSTTSIGDRAFSGCTGLVSVSIPNSVTSIGDGAFANCPKLTITCYEGSYAEGYAKSNKIKYEALPGGADNAPIDSNIADAGKLGDNVRYTLYKDGLLSVTGTGDMWGGYGSSSPFVGNTAINRITIAEGVTSIESGKFEDCPNLTSVELPNGIHSIGAAAFRGCLGLTEIKLPDSVNYIGYSAFENCTSLKSITMPKKSVAIGERAFAGCESLESIIVPDGIKEIRERTFAYCTSLTDIELPDTLTKIGQCAFQFCESLPELTIPQSVKKIEAGAFASCKSITVKCYPETAGETYLKEHDHKYEVIDDE